MPPRRDRPAVLLEHESPCRRTDSEGPRGGFRSDPSARRMRLLVRRIPGIDVKAVEGVAFNLVGVFMASAVVPSKSKHLRRLRDEHGKDDGKVQEVDPALSENQPEFGSCRAGDIQVLLIVTAFRFQARSVAPVCWQGLVLLDKQIRFRGPCTSPPSATPMRPAASDPNDTSPVDTVLRTPRKAGSGECGRNSSRICLTSTSIGAGAAQPSRIGGSLKCGPSPSGTRCCT